MGNMLNVIESLEDMNEGALFEMFTRRHFNLFAEMLSDMAPEENAKWMDKLVPMFQQQNPRFDEQRFREAAKPKGGGAEAEEPAAEMPMAAEPEGEQYEAKLREKFLGEMVSGPCPELYDAAIAAVAQLGDLVRDGQASEEDERVYNELKQATEAYEAQYAGGGAE